MKNPRARLRIPVNRELDAAATARGQGDLPTAWLALERAHVLSLPSAWLHTRVHAAMLVLAIRTRDLREVGGQIVRVSFAGIASLLGVARRGNRGRAHVPLLQTMPVEADLAAILDGGVTSKPTTDSRSPGPAAARATD